MKRLVFIALFSSICLTPAHSQEEYWNEGIKSFKSEKYSEAIQNFKQYLRSPKATQRPSTTFRIATSYYHLHKLDSAIHYYKKTLQQENISHINQRTVLGLSRSYLQKGDFEKAFDTTIDHLKENLNDKAALSELQDICLWVYLIKHHYLNADYLTNYIKKPSYIINSVAAQKLIARNIRNQTGHKFDSDRMKQVGLAQRWYGTFYNEKEEQSIHFIFIDPDLIESVVVQDETASKVLVDKTLPLYERLGAFYFLTPLSNEKMELALEQEEEIFRFCTCLEIPDYIANRHKKICKKDKRALIKAVVEHNSAF